MFSVSVVDIDIVPWKNRDVNSFVKKFFKKFWGILGQGGAIKG
ncbi:hypothetical protein 101117BS1_247 [Escherichia phage vB_EcoM-101117BS1]|nr:hypothetical protein 101117BS1_247 [Escherichia phage vB_EcoM-101117BS1]